MMDRRKLIAGFVALGAVSALPLNTVAQERKLSDEELRRLRLKFKGRRAPDDAENEDRDPGPNNDRGQGDRDANGNGGRGDGGNHNTTMAEFGLRSVDYRPLVVKSFSLQSKTTFG